MKELPPIAHEQRNTYSADHDIIGEISGVEQFANEQIGQLRHEPYTGLSAEERLLPADDGWIEIIRKEHSIDQSRLTEKRGVQKHGIKMTQEIQRRVGMAATVPLNDPVDHEESCKVGAYEDG